MTAVNKPLHIGLFLATCLTTFGACLFFYGGGVIGSLEDKLWGSGYFALTVVGILLAHELGHYFMAKHHGVDSSWPYFIPFPFGFGTLGAVIRLRGRIPNRNALVDIGAAGPLAGLLICIPMLAVGVALSHVDTLPSDLDPGVPPPYSLINLAAKLGEYVSFLVRGTTEPTFPERQFFGDSLLSWILVRLIHGELKPGTDLYAHPIFLAAWFGQLMTMLNLLPVGQLDGGHVTHAFYGTDKAEALGVRIAKGALVLSLFFSVSWLIWFFLATRIVGTAHPPVEKPDEPLTRGRRIVVYVTWVMTALTFMPMPISVG
ncbi:MAG: site-2 protease family protein [Archangium sp.]|nr:site-2 protease family protein [Archangium sp.]